MGELQKIDDKVLGLEDFFKGQFKRIEGSMPEGLEPARFTRIIVTEFQRNPELFETMTTALGRASVYASVMTAAQLGLEIGSHLGQAFLIPRKDKHAGGAKMCNFQIGYQGLIQLAYNAGVVSDIRCKAVYDGEPWSYKDGTRPTIDHEPTEKPMTDEDLRAVYCVLTFKDGNRHPEVMYLWELERVMKKAKASSGSFMWSEWMIEGYLKTVLKRALKYCPKSAAYKSMAQVLAHDDGIETMTPDVPEFREVTGTVVSGPLKIQKPITEETVREARPIPDDHGIRFPGMVHFISPQKWDDGKTVEWICKCGVILESQEARDNHERETADA